MKIIKQKFGYNVVLMAIALVTLSACGGGGGGGSGGGSGSGASGRISLAINVDGTRTHTTSPGFVEVKKELGSGTLVYHLANGVVQQTSGNGRSVDWMDASFGGETTKTSEHSTTYAVICNGGGTQQLTDKTITTTRFSSTSGGAQVTGVGVYIAADGSYTLTIGPSTSLTAGSATTVRTVIGQCETPPSTTTNTAPSLVPFSHYFVAYTGGKTGLTGTIGTINPAEPNRVQGVYHGTDVVTVFENGTTPITIPFKYTITWDISLGN